MLEKDFVIGKVSWFTHLKITPPLSLDRVDAYRKSFENLFEWLQDNKLTKRVLLEKNQNVTDDMELRVSDLTDLGYKVIKKSYDKWLGKIDRAKDKFKAVNDLSLFEKVLKELS